MAEWSHIIADEMGGIYLALKFNEAGEIEAMQADDRVLRMLGALDLDTALAAEREKCAKVCEARAALYRDKADQAPEGEPMFGRDDMFRLNAEACEYAAAAIRNQEKKE